MIERNKLYVEPGPGHYKIDGGNATPKLGSLILPKKKSASRLLKTDGKPDEIAPGYYDTSDYLTLGKSLDQALANHEKNENHQILAFGSNKKVKRFKEDVKQNLGPGVYKNHDPYRISAPKSTLFNKRITIAGADYSNTKILHKKIQQLIDLQKDREAEARIALRSKRQEIEDQETGLSQGQSQIELAKQKLEREKLRTK